MITIEYVKTLCREFYSCGKLNKKFAIVFVYNDCNNADDLHQSECITPNEHLMILNSFREIAEFVYSFNSEDSFIENIKLLQFKHKHLLVYSMAQNINGIGRRALIPLICKYYNLINIGSNEYSSFLSGDKKLMHQLLCNENLNFPQTIFIDRYNFPNLIDTIKSISDGKYIIKPIDESASIGVKVVNYSRHNMVELEKELLKYALKYNSFCLQEFIDGKEVEVPVMKIREEFFSPGVCEIVFEQCTNYLDYDTVGMNAYGFTTYTDFKQKIVDNAKCVAKTLEFDVLGRIDFRIKNGIPYIIDIGANPTISTHSTTNYLFKKVFGSESIVYHLLVIISLMRHNLFKPSLDEPQQHRHAIES